MFYYKTSFSKKAVFLEKIAKNHLWEDMTVLRGVGHLATKVNITFFVGVDVLNIFHLTTFSKKTIFSKISAKNYFWGAWPFLRERRADDKNECNLFFFFFFWKIGYPPNTQTKFLSFFSKTPISSDLNPKNLFWGHIFPHICGSIGPIVSKNNRVHPWVNPHQRCEFHENQFNTVTCIVISYKYISIYEHC